MIAFRSWRGCCVPFMRGRVHHFHLDRVLAVITKIDEIRQLVTRSIPSPMTLAFAESREARHSRNSHHPLAMGDGFATTLVRCFAAACRVARPFSPANGDFYSRASGESPGNGIVAISRHASHQKAPHTQNGARTDNRKPHPDFGWCKWTRNGRMVVSLGFTMLGLAAPLFHNLFSWRAI